MSQCSLLFHICMCSPLFCTFLLVYPFALLCLLLLGLAWGMLWHMDLDLGWMDKLGIIEETSLVPLSQQTLPV